MERSYGTFQRALRLPGPVDPEQVQASFENGVLTVSVPKSEQQERSRRIQIQGGSRSGESGGATQIEGKNTAPGGKGSSRSKSA
jgi:HSP20 family protein